jgi:prepilin-type N-terminal cleavage/methylation domain-containing protein
MQTRIAGYTKVNIRSRTTAQTAFTLIELLVVIAIIGLLVGLLLPVQAAREAARRMQCSNNLKQLGLGMLSYESAHRKLPAGMRSTLAMNLSDLFGSLRGHSWGMSILPHIEQSSIYDNIDFGIPVIPSFVPSDTNANKEFLKGKSIATFICPSDTRPLFEDRNPIAIGFGFASYVGNFGTNGYLPVAESPLIRNWPWTLTRNRSFARGLVIESPVFGMGPNVIRGWYGTGPLFPFGQTSLSQITDGTSNTALIFESGDWESKFPSTREVYWTGGPRMGYSLGTTSTKPNWCRGLPRLQTTYCGGNLGSLHTGGLQSVLADGSVNFISNSIESADVVEIDGLLDIRKPGNVYRAWQHLSVMNDGNPIPEF